MLQEACHKEEMHKMQVCEWHKRFHDGPESVNDDPCCGRPSNLTNEENIKSVRNFV